MKSITVLMLAGWTAAVSVNAQSIRFDGDGRVNESLSAQLSNQPAPQAPPGREPRERGPGPDQGWHGGRHDRLRGHPDRWDGGSVRRLAERIHEDADKLHRDYDEASRTGNFFQKISRAAGLQLLSELSSAAHRFHREVDSRWSDPVETRENYLDLVRALDQADDEFFLAYRADSVRGQYRRVSDSIEELIRYYRYRDGGRDRDDRDRGGYGHERCEGVNFYGKWYVGGGCDFNGCWREGGGCNFYGCWEYGGGCGFNGCWREGGSCNNYGCIGGVPKLPSQPCVE